MISLHHLLLVSGVGHFGIVIASCLVPLALDWRKQLAPLHPFIRSMVWVYGVFIVLATISFGALTLLHAREMAAGEPVARSVSAVIALYWAARLMVQWFVFDPRDFLTSIWRKLGDHTLTAAFIFLAAVHGWAALHRLIP